MTPPPLDRKLHMLHTLRGRLIVSCQAYPGEPLRDPDTMARIAQSAVIGGAAAIRSQGLDDIRAIARAVAVPQIGLWKVGADGVFITPTLEHAIAVAEAGADIVALDGTRRERPDGLTLRQTIHELKQRTVLETETLNLGASLYEQLRAAGHEVFRAEQEIKAITLSPLDSELLDVPQGSAALSVTRVSSSRRGHLVEFARTTYRADRYTFQLAVTRDDK